MLVKLLVLKQNYREVFVLQIKTKNDIKKKKKKKKKKNMYIYIYIYIRLIQVIVTYMMKL